MAVAKKPEPVKTNSGIVGQVEAFCTSVANAIPVPQFKPWVAGYFQPEATIEAEKNNAGFVNIAIHAVLIGVITGIVSFIVGMASSLTMALTAPRGLAVDFVATIIMSIATVILAPIFMFIGSAVYFILAKIMGGKGGYMQQTLGLTLVAGGLTLISAPLQILGAIPCLGFVFSLVAMAFGLYGIYSQYRLIKAVHQISGMKAALVIIIPIIVMVVLVIIMVLVMGAALLGLGAVAGGLNGY